VTPQGEGFAPPSPLAPPDLLAIVRAGLLAGGGPPKKVAVVGAGMAGLVAAWELLRAGHHPIVLEARGRVGGRIYTLRENLTVIHPQAAREFEVGASYMWHDHEFAGGAFALFDPGQHTRLHDAIVAPEGRIFFAGEHASLAHAWIQGAIESGLRAALAIHTAPAR
jgi:monoamine oxidase